MEVAGPLGTPLGLAQRKRASPRGPGEGLGGWEAGDVGWVVVAWLATAAGSLMPTCDEASAILVHSDAGCVALENCKAPWAPKDVSVPWAWSPKPILSVSIF